MKIFLATILTLLSVASFGFIMPPTEKPLPKVSGEIQDKAIEAIFNGDIEALKKLVREGADPNFSYSGNTNIFHIVTRSSSIENRGIKYPVKFSKESLDALRYLISLGVKTDRFTGANGSTPLVDALDGVSGDYPHCRAGLIKVLLEGGADPDKGSRSSATYKVWSPFRSATPFCGTEALEVYFSYNPDFLRGRCQFPSRVSQRDQDVLDEYIGNGAKTPIVMLYEYFEEHGIPAPSLDGPFGLHENNPEWLEWEKRCPDYIAPF